MGKEKTNAEHNGGRGMGIKQLMGLRQFLHRGLEKVRMEWLWACIGLNLCKLVSALRKLHAGVATLTA